MDEKRELVTELWQRGYAVIPHPLNVRLEAGDLAMEPGWKLVLSQAVSDDDVAVTSLVEGLKAKRSYVLERASSQAEGAKVVRLDIKEGIVGKGAPEGIANQGYLLTITPEGVEIIGNAPAGLYYGVVTFLQLTRRTFRGALRLPLCTIEDWPDVELRTMHLDTKHHQDRLEALMEYIVRASEFKINCIGWEIEDKFAYERHPIIGAPGAFTKKEMQQLAAHALKHHVEIMPIIQGPSHLSFLLKHEEFEHLREDIHNNYMLCPSKDESYQLLFDMYDEMIEATPGCKYFHVGTDEAYFLGDGERCGCAEKARKIGPGGIFAEFVTRCSEYLEAKGRQVMIWGERPLTPADIPRLPETIINCVVQNAEWVKAYKKHGIREIIYVATQGWHPFFPDYLQGRFPGGPGEGRIEHIYKVISFGSGRESKLLGTFVAAWDDGGLHNETFWLGWVAGAEYGWSPGVPSPEEYIAKFMRLFYGPEAREMVEVYHLLGECSAFWHTSWDRVPAKRGPSYYRRFHPRHDRALSLPRVPDALRLNNEPYWGKHYAELLEGAKEQQVRLARLTELLMDNMARVSRNRYNLEVLLSVARLLEHHVRMLKSLAGVEEMLNHARQVYVNTDFDIALNHLRSAADAVKDIIKDRENTFRALQAVWEKSRLPKGMSVGDKKFIHVLDDTKYHTANRTPDLSYLIEPERELDLEGWVDRLEAVTDEFARLSKTHDERMRPRTKPPTF